MFTIITYVPMFTIIVEKMTKSKIKFFLALKTNVNRNGNVGRKVNIVYDHKY